MNTKQVNKMHLYLALNRPVKILKDTKGVSGTTNNFKMFCF